MREAVDVAQVLGHRQPLFVLGQRLVELTTRGEDVGEATDGDCCAATIVTSAKGLPCGLGVRQSGLRAAELLPDVAGFEHQIGVRSARLANGPQIVADLGQVSTPTRWIGLCCRPIRRNSSSTADGPASGTRSTVTADG